MPLVKGADLRGSYYYDRSTHFLRSRESEHRASAGSSVVKGVATSISRDLLKGTKYEWDTRHLGATFLSIRDTTAGRIKDGKPVGTPVFRVDKPHGNLKSPHINVKPDKFGLDHKPIPQAAFKAASHAGEIAQGLKDASRLLGETGAAMDAYDIYQGYKADRNKIGNHTKQDARLEALALSGSAESPTERSLFARSDIEPKDFAPTVSMTPIAITEAKSSTRPSLCPFGNVAFER